MASSKMLSEKTAEDILTMVTVEKRFPPGGKLPNENDLAEELGVSRTTLREAIRTLTARGVLQIRRGLGTYVVDTLPGNADLGLASMSDIKVSAKDLYEMRLIFEPEAAYYAASRATEKELQAILKHGGDIEVKIHSGEDRTLEEQCFHKAIAKATHNEFMSRLVPLLFQAIDKGVSLSETNQQAQEATLLDHRAIMDFLKRRDAEGARTAMKLHILRAMGNLGL